MSTLQRARAERSMIELARFSKQERSKGFFGEPLKHVITHIRANFGKKKIGDKRGTQRPVKMLKNVRKTLVLPMKSEADDDPSLSRVSTPHVPVCTFNTSPCVSAPRAHVETRLRVVPVHLDVFERTHGDVLSGHTCFSPCHTPHHTTPHTPHHTAPHRTAPHRTAPHPHRTAPHTHHNTRQNIPQHTTTTRPQHLTKTETERQRQKTETEKRREERREERRFIFSVVVHGRS